MPGETAEEVDRTRTSSPSRIDLHARFGVTLAVHLRHAALGTGLARGRALPVVSDWGPLFQTRDLLQPGALVPEETLRALPWTFDQLQKASRGPRKVVMNVTYVTTNNHCTFCAVGTRTHGSTGHPTRQRVSTSTSIARKASTWSHFDGGEPTLNPELIPLVRYARSIG